MSASASIAASPDAVKPKKGKAILALAALLLLGAAAAAGYFLVLKKPAEGESEPVAHAQPKAPPVFIPMDNMVVNLADRGGDRFAQIGLSLQVSDPKVAEQIKLYLPSIRSAVLLLISQRTAEELLQREGKEKLATEILRESAKAMGMEVDDDEPPHAVESERKPDRKKKKRPAPNPVQEVLFSSFIVQ